MKNLTAEKLLALASAVADTLRASDEPSMTVYELAEAIAYCINDDASESRLLEYARDVFKRVTEIRSGYSVPCCFKEQIRGGE